MSTTPLNAFSKLHLAFGPQNWWPVTPPGKAKPEYTGGPITPKQKWEVVAGAILTQNAAWSNAEKALKNLNLEKLDTPDAVAKASLQRIKEAVHPAGYFNQKANYLQSTARYLVRNYSGNLETMFLRPAGALRHELLSLKGIGPETADSILLYSAGKCKFVVDAYTRRIVHRLGWLEKPAYGRTQAFFEENLPRDVFLFQEYHALLVALSKRNCLRNEPVCNTCPLKIDCKKRMD